MTKLARAWQALALPVVVLTSPLRERKCFYWSLHPIRVWTMYAIRILFLNPLA